LKLKAKFISYYKFRLWK